MNQIKRKEVSYIKKIVSDSERKADEVETKPDEWDKNEYFRTMFGTRNFANIVKDRVERMRNLDSFMGRMMPNRYRKFFSDQMEAFAELVFQSEQEEQKIREQFDGQGNMFQLVEDRDGTSNEKMEQLHSRVDKLVEDTTEEIKRIEDESNAKFGEWQATVEKDIEGVSGLDISTEEMKSAISEALEKVKSGIQRQAEIIKKEISEKTSPLHKIIDGSEALRI